MTKITSSPPLHYAALRGCLVVEVFCLLQGCCKRGAEGASAPQFLAKQLTLSQPGGQIMPTTVIQAPPGFSDLATALYVFCIPLASRELNT